MSKTKTAAARNAVARTDEQHQEVAVISPGAPPAFLNDCEMSGQGVSTDAADNLVPMARVLQKGSPQVDRQAPTYIRDAEAGMIFLKNAPVQVIDGINKGFLFQPVYFDKKVVEWLPRNKGGGGGAGYVKAHETMPATCVQKPDPQNPDKMQWVDPKTGNTFVDTRYHVGYMISEDGSQPPMPLCIPFSSTGHTVSKNWMFLQNQKVLGGKRADAWAVVYRFRTELKSKGTNTWFIFHVTDAGAEVEGQPTTRWVSTREDFDRGKSLFLSLKSGETKIDTAAAVDDAATSTSDDKM